MYYTQDNEDLYIAPEDKECLNKMWDQNLIIPLLTLAPKIEPKWNKFISLLAIFVFLKISKMDTKDFLEHFEIEEDALNEVVIKTILQK